MNQLRPEVLSKFAEEYKVPTPEEIRFVVKQSGKTGRELGQMLGVDGRTIRRWSGGDREIPYAAWRLLIFSTGLIDSEDLT